jgi:hypothetical protein
MVEAPGWDELSFYDRLEGGGMSRGLFLWVAGWAAGVLPAGELHGTVRSKNGEPIFSAFVSDVTENNARATTNRAGEFVLKTGGKRLLLIHADGFRPVLRQEDASANQVEVTLEDGRATELRLRGRAHRGKAPELRLALPPGARPTVIHDDDYARTIVVHKGPSGERGALELWSGAYVSGGVPLPDWFEGQERFEIRGVRCADLHGIDVKARDASGRRSRWVSVPFHFVEYRRVNAEAAHTFDPMIDGMTCR